MLFSVVVVVSFTFLLLLLLLFIVLLLLLLFVWGVGRAKGQWRSFKGQDGGIVLLASVTVILWPTCSLESLCIIVICIRKIHFIFGIKLNKSHV